MTTFDLRRSGMNEETIEFSLESFFINNGDTPVELSSDGEFTPDGINWHGSLRGLSFQGSSPPAINVRAFNKQGLTLGTFTLRKDEVPDHATFRIRLKVTQPVSEERELLADFNIADRTSAITPGVPETISLRGKN